MKSQLILLENLSGKKASFYSIISDNSKVSLFHQFITNNIASHEAELMNIAGRLRSMGNLYGAAKTFFKLDEGLSYNDLVCALYDMPDSHLRLYCIRLSDKIVILGNGGHKSKRIRAWQEDNNLSRAVHELMGYSGILRNLIRTGSIRENDNGLFLKGNLILTSNNKQ